MWILKRVRVYWFICENFQSEILCAFSCPTSSQFQPTSFQKKRKGMSSSDSVSLSTSIMEVDKLKKRAPVPGTVSLERVSAIDSVCHGQEGMITLSLTRSN